MDRRSFLRGLVAAPAIVAIDSIMPVRKLILLEPLVIVNGGTGFTLPAMKVTRMAFLPHMYEQIWATFPTFGELIN